MKKTINVILLVIIIALGVFTLHHQFCECKTNQRIENTIKLEKDRASRVAFPK